MLFPSVVHYLTPNTETHTAPEIYHLNCQVSVKVKLNNLPKFLPVSGLCPSAFYTPSTPSLSSWEFSLSLALSA